MDNLERVDLEMIRKAPLFESLEQEALQQLAAGATVEVLAEGAQLFRQGELASRFFLVVAGQVALTRASPHGDEKVIELLGPGQTFAEALMFMGAPRYPVNARALGTTRVVALDSRNFTEILRASVDLCFRLMANMSVRLHRLLGEVEALTLQSAAVRIVNFLLEQLPEGALSPASVALPVPKHVIASRLSIKPETFSRILHEMTVAGVIVVQGPLIEINDIKTLTRYA
jgi:CRP-like cAMP-binding protein